MQHLPVSRVPAAVDTLTVHIFVSVWISEGQILFFVVVVFLCCGIVFGFLVFFFFLLKMVLLVIAMYSIFPLAHLLLWCQML